MTRRRTSRRMTPNAKSFVQEISPLDYGTTRSIKRLAIIDPDVAGPSKNLTYFQETTVKSRGPTGRVKESVIPGATPSTLSFIDYSIGPGGAYIHFMTTRADQRNRGLSRELLAEFMRKMVSEGIDTVDFGRIASPHAWKLYQSYRKAYESGSGKIAVYGKHDF